MRLRLICVSKRALRKKVLYLLSFIHIKTKHAVKILLEGRDNMHADNLISREPGHQHACLCSINNLQYLVPQLRKVGILLLVPNYDLIQFWHDDQSLKIQRWIRVYDVSILTLKNYIFMSYLKKLFLMLGSIMKYSGSIGRSWTMVIFWLWCETFL